MTTRLFNGATKPSARFLAVTAKIPTARTPTTTRLQSIPSGSQHFNLFNAHRRELVTQARQQRKAQAFSSTTTLTRSPSLHQLQPRQLGSPVVVSGYQRHISTFSPLTPITQQHNKSFQAFAQQYRSFATLTAPTTSHSILTPINHPFASTITPHRFATRRRHLTTTRTIGASRRHFTSTRSQFVFQQGLGRAGQSRSRLGAVSKPEAAKVPDPLGIEAKQKRLEAQLQAMKEGKEYDQFAGLTDEQRTKQLEYLAQMKRMEDTMGWIDFIMSQSATYYIFWYIIIGTLLASSYYIYIKFIVDPDDMPMLNSVPGLRDVWDGKIPKDSYEYNENFLKTLATADQIASTATKFSDPKFVSEIQHKTHGKVEGAYVPTGPEQYPNPQEWRVRAPVIRTFVHAGVSYPDYVGNGHFHIYHNGKDSIPKILKRIQRDNFGMPFTFQILSFAEIHQIFTTPNYKPRSMEQLMQEADAGEDSLGVSGQLKDVLAALEAAKKELQEAKPAPQPEPKKDTIQDDTKEGVKE